MSLWNSPMIKDAWNSLSEEDKKNYMRVGELVYNTLDYTTGKLIDNSSNELQELLMAINGGIIRSLEECDEDEVKLLKHYYTDSDIEALFK